MHEHLTFDSARLTKARLKQEIFFLDTIFRVLKGTRVVSITQVRFSAKLFTSKRSRLAYVSSSLNISNSPINKFSLNK